MCVITRTHAKIHHMQGHVLVKPTHTTHTTHAMSDAHLTHTYRDTFPPGRLTHSRGPCRVMTHSIQHVWLSIAIINH